MWFKNLALLRFTEAFTLSAGELERRLETGRFHPCSSLQPMSYGWVPPIGGEDAPLVHTTQGCYMLCACKEEKILPAHVINEMLAEKIAEREAQQGTAVRKKDREVLRDEIIHDLLPRAFSFTRRQYAYIDAANGWLIVDSASAKKTEELASWLRRSLGSLPVRLPAVNERPATVMTRWLAEAACPSDFVIENECELRGSEDEGSLVRCKRHDLSAPEIQNHIEAGKVVSKLALRWHERLSFVLDDALGIKRLRFLELVQEQAAEVESDDEIQRFDSDFAIMSSELATFLPRLLELFGGEAAQPM